jgi:acyl-coenzyme A synthetase/AMP-(fatty) acid ligase
MTFVTSRAELLANAVTYERAVYDHGALVAQIPHTKAWVALYNDDHAEPRWMVVPAKFAGYAGNTVAAYETDRKEMSGTKSLKALDKLGLGEVGRSHPAFRALRDLAKEAGVELRSEYRLLMLDGEDLPRTEAAVVNSILPVIAGLSREARLHVANRLLAA